MKLVTAIVKPFKVEEIRLRVSKPGALRFSKDVGVIIERNKSSYE